MGNKVNISHDSLNKITKETNINTKDIKKIHKKFHSLDRNNKGFVTVADISKLSEIEKNPLSHYICQSLITNSEHQDEVNFEYFIKILDIFKNGKVDEQYKYLFELFDFNKDGKIGYEDLLLNLKLLLCNSLTEEQLIDIVEKTIAEYSNDQQYITYEEFVKIIDL